MKKVVGIGFKEVGKIYWFESGQYNLSKDDSVVVETIRGLELGTVIQEPRPMNEHELEHELKPVLRIANKQDLKTYEENQTRAEDALQICKNIVKIHGLDMKLLQCEYTLDRQKIIFYYNADGRVDFRELLKDLASEFKTRIELRQIGPREGAKFIGGLGPCGRECCCAQHLREFNLVTMKMAKEQGMTLNASKVAGLCGKLMCCIGYENSLYEEIRNRIPLVGDRVKTPTCGICKVVGVEYLKEQIKTIKDDQIMVWQANELEKVESHKEEENPNDLTDDIIEDGINS
ncbi:MAG: stage 0 sporulation family protein [Bacilli bacterium]|nr:stage 0 sporulation family protein [Bacilli bacterium]